MAKDHAQSARDDLHVLIYRPVKKLKNWLYADVEIEK